MTPNLGQGGAQALEDAAALAEALRSEDDADRALRSYEARRIPRTTMIVRRSHTIGGIAQLRNPVACALRDALVRATPKRVQVRQQELVLGAEP
jgi:2-polyprenyl-6-methoxyphenol hydroxylase-like FAD-dependent oxidoreductase